MPCGRRPYTDPDVAAGTTVKAVYITELRTALMNRVTWMYRRASAQEIDLQFFESIERDSAARS